MSNAKTSVIHDSLVYEKCKKRIAIMIAIHLRLLQMPNRLHLRLPKTVSEFLSFLLFTFSEYLSFLPETPASGCNSHIKFIPAKRLSTLAVHQ